MSNYLLIPIHLDALCRAENTRSAKALADYRQLPYVYQGDTHQTGTPNLSETVLTPLFNTDLTLKAGIHLHWSLPDALTRGQQSSTGTKFPVVPNRWLILRQGGDKGNKQWIVESDYLYPENLEEEEEPAATINILIERPNPETQNYQRYRYLGRTLELSAWQQGNSSRGAGEQRSRGAEGQRGRGAGDSSTDEYIENLTAIGPKAEVPLFDQVQATFAAFYPNCQSVFGFYDSEYSTNNPPAGLQYDVIGWYSKEEQDCLQIFLQSNSGKDSEELLELLQEEFRWTFTLNGEFPQRSLYHARVTFASAGRAMTAGDRIRSLNNPAIAVGNSAAEALSAYLAHNYNSQTNQEGEQIRQAVEEQLEALQLSERLESRKLDLDAKLRESRHERGFGTRSAGILWSIQPQVSSATSFAVRSEPIEVTLPLELAHQLNQVNHLQEEYNQALANIESQRQQLYTYWYEFMKHLYQVDGDDSLLWPVINIFLNPLRQTLAKTGRLELKKDQAGNLTAEATPLAFGLFSKLSVYFEDYVEVMSDAAQRDFDDWEDVENDLKTLLLLFNVELSGEPEVTEITAEEAWEVKYPEQTYPIKVEDSIFNIYIPPKESQLAYQLATAINALIEAIATYKQYTLKQFPSQRYWQPNDPVILLAGEAAKASRQHGQDGRLRSDNRLECHITAESLDLATLPSTTISSLQNTIESLKPENDTEAIGFERWTQQPWSPFLMQWGVQVFPCRPDAETDYDPKVILNNYELKRNAIDLSLKTGKESNFINSANTYSGMSILTPSAGLILQERLTTYLNEQVLADYYIAHVPKIPEAERTEDYLSQHFEEVKQWYNNPRTNLTEIERAKDPGCVALYAYEQMQTLECQAQALGGFNDTLLLYQPTFSLEIDDPITLSDDHPWFHEQVRWTLGRSLQYKILTLDSFNPLRSGAMKITTLSLVDTFGQVKEIVETGMDTDVVTTTAMTPPNRSYQVLLPPRLAQPARLNFHWIAADSQNEEQINQEPAITPVCGWIVPNNLDSNLQFYDADGHALGLIDRAGTWRSAPGSTLSRNARNYPEFANPHLQKVVHYLLELGMDFQQDFISTLVNSLDTIEPENFAEHPSLALLVGRPIVIVRATFNLEVQGLPACDPTVSVTDLETIEDEDENVIGVIPNTGGFDAVKFAIRLGDYQQLNDGLVGYWREVHEGEDYNYEGNIFYAPQSNLIKENLIQTEAEGLVYFEQTVDAPPQYVTMLIDPRGTIHTTSGILPNQELRLPPENYNEALQAIEVNFISAPILSNLGEIGIPLPEVPEYAWSWVSLNGSEWSETEAIKPVNVKATFSAPQKLYEGWLQLTPVEDGE